MDLPRQYVGPDETIGATMVEQLYAYVGAKKRIREQIVWDKVLVEIKARLDDDSHKTQHGTLKKVRSKLESRGTSNPEAFDSESQELEWEIKHSLIDRKVITFPKELPILLTVDIVLIALFDFGFENRA